MLEVMGLESGSIDRKKQLHSPNQINMLTEAPSRRMASSISSNTPLSSYPKKLPPLKIHKQKSDNPVAKILIKRNKFVQMTNNSPS